MHHMLFSYLALFPLLHNYLATSESYKVLKTMEENDSRECRNCHQMTAMALANQSRRARNQHDSAIVGVEDGDTCIDCHKGIAHKSVHLDLEEDADIEEEEDYGDF